MSETSSQVLELALTLPPDERATVVEAILDSLEPTDARIDAAWAREAESRLAAYRAGRLDAVPADEVFAEFDRP